MSIWFLNDPERFLWEKSEIEKLQLDKNWLLGVEWLFVSSELAVKVQIKAHNHIYEIDLVYPSFFPYSPPIVKPLEKGERWSEHQYSDGSLCLEWGPDNWHNSITGAMVLESAFRLIFTENPKGKKQEDNSLVPSRHSLTLGQELRNKLIRLYLNNHIINIISKSKTSYMEFNFEVLFENNIIVHIGKVIRGLTILWENHYLPNSLKGKMEGSGFIFHINNLPEEIKSIDELEQLLLSLELSINSKFFDQNSEKLYLLIDESGEIHSFLCFKNQKKLYKLAHVFDNDNIVRLPSEFVNLKEKKVGIVGLGSLGSKLAESLARSGVGKFFLVDDDIFLSGNIQRHTLDWNSVGSHKVDALKNKIQLISACVEVEVSKINVTGQEATTSLNGVLTLLGECDVIIDATAESRVFNLLSRVCKIYDKPLIWGEIFAGGIGGLIARSRPNDDPSPQTMRNILYQSTNDMPSINRDTARPYEIMNENDEVWIASDADVGILSTHLTRFTLDTIKNEDSDYPFSMYLIGFKKAWVFEQPFDTIPIQTHHLIDRIEQKEKDPEKLKQLVDFLGPLLEAKKDD